LNLQSTQLKKRSSTRTRPKPAICIAGAACARTIWLRRISTRLASITPTAGTARDGSAQAGTGIHGWPATPSCPAKRCSITPSAGDFTRRGLCTTRRFGIAGTTDARWLELIRQFEMVWDRSGTRRPHTVASAGARATFTVETVFTVGAGLAPERWGSEGTGKARWAPFLYNVY